MSLWRDCSIHTCSYTLQRNPLLKLIGIGLIVLTSLSIVIGLIVHFTTRNNDSPLQKAEKLLAEIILFDGFNDFATNAREQAANDLTRFNFSANLSVPEENPGWPPSPFSQTDLPRLKAGFVKAQFFVARADCDSQFRDATEITLEQIDVIKRLISNYSDHTQLATSVSEVREAVEAGKLASLIGVSGGHSISFSLAILRIFYELGVRYMSLTSKCSTPWADGASVDSYVASERTKSVNDGLSKFGEQVVAEMNRLGMIIDLSHSSVATMKAVLYSSKAPVIFSNSNAKGLCLNHHNVPDEMLNMVKHTDSVVMVNFYPRLLNCDMNDKANLTDVVAQLDYLKKKMSANNIGLGSDFDGIDKAPEGLEDTSKFPNLFAALYETGTWTHQEMEKLAGRNILRLMEQVERIRDKLEDEIPRQTWLRKSDLRKMNYTLLCTSAKLPDPYPGHPYERYS